MPPDPPPIDPLADRVLDLVERSAQSGVQAAREHRAGLEAMAAATSAMGERVAAVEAQISTLVAQVVLLQPTGDPAPAERGAVFRFLRGVAEVVPQLRWWVWVLLPLLGSLSTCAGGEVLHRFLAVPPSVAPVEVPIDETPDSEAVRDF